MVECETKLIRLVQIPIVEKNSYYEWMKEKELVNGVGSRERLLIVVVHAAHEDGDRRCLRRTPREHRCDSQPLQ